MMGKAMKYDVRIVCLLLVRCVSSGERGPAEMA